MIESIVRNPKVALICFTGSVAGGLAVQKAAADRVVLVGLELGGKDPAYIRADVDIAWAAEEIVDGAVFNSGQSCCSIERVYVDEKIHDAFVEAVQTVLKGYKLGDPFDKHIHLGPVISKRSKATIEAHIENALEKGAKDMSPENESFQSPPPEGNFVKPTLLIDVDHSMTVMTEETFGPVIPVMRVKNDAEAIKLMNDSEFGLTANIDAGTVFVNRCDFPSPVSYLSEFRCGPSHFRINHTLGSCLDWMEELWKGCHFECLWVRAIRETEEFPYQGLSEIMTRCPDFLELARAADDVCNNLMTTTTLRTRNEALRQELSLEEVMGVSSSHVG
jgi:Aldehyde dehydrogenase family